MRAIANGNAVTFYRDRHARTGSIGTTMLLEALLLLRKENQVRELLERDRAVNAGERSVAAARARVADRQLRAIGNELGAISPSKRSGDAGLERRDLPSSAVASLGGGVQMRAAAGGTMTIGGMAARFYAAADSGTEYRLSKSVTERIRPGAFTAALKRPDDVRGLFNHDSNWILARSASGTLSLVEDARGLSYRMSIPAGSARPVVSAIERGDVSGSSFAFMPDQVTIEHRGNDLVRWIDSVTLFDVGPVTFPAYASTTSFVRS